MIIYGLRYILRFLQHRFKNISFPVAFEQGVMVKNPQFISIGKRVYIGANCILQIPDEYKEFTETPKLVIGKKVTIGMGTMISAIRSITIGSNVLIAPHVFISDHIHKYSDIDVPIRFQGVDKIMPVVIEDNAWICTQVVINGGVRIGKQSIVGANSVVTKDIPPYSLAVGNPARVIKQYNFDTQQWEKR